MSNVFLILAFSILTTVSAQLCFKKGVLGLGQLSFSFSGIFHLILQIFQSPWLIAGTVLFGISFLLWIFILSKIQLSIAYPVVQGLNFCLIVAASWFLFKEHLSLLQILGIATIISGIFLVLFKG